MISPLAFLFPQKIEEQYSKINGRISVEKFRGHYRVVVNNLTQSGGLVESLWKEALENLKANPKKILILGLGAGTLALLLFQKFPNVKIIGVEIDPTMIEIGKKYFNLDKIKNLSIKIIDAEKYFDKSKFDLIFVDLYQGEIFPKKFESYKFLEKLSQKVGINGLVIYNRLNFQNHIFEAKKFLDKLNKIFKDINCKKINYNLLVFARN